MCAAANGLRALNFPCASRLVVSQRVVPGEIKVLPSDGGGMAKRLVVDLKCRGLLTSSFHRRLDAILSRDQPLAYYF